MIKIQHVALEFQLADIFMKGLTALVMKEDGSPLELEGVLRCRATLGHHMSEFLLTEMIEVM